MKIICKEINDYLRWCYSNPDKINKKRWLLIQNIVEPTLKREDIYFDKKTYKKCLDYCKKWYYELFPFQKFIYAFIFMYKDDVPIFRTFVIMMGRGNGKDGMIAPLLNFLQTPLYGIKNYNIDIVATSEEQAQGTFDIVYEMLSSNKDRFKDKFYVSQEKIVNYETNSVLRYNTSNSKTKDGKKSGLILFNEYHAYQDLKQVNVFNSCLGKIPHPRTIIITTQGIVRDGPLDELLEICSQILQGESNELGYFPFLCELDDVKEIDNPKLWIKSNPAIDFFPVLKDEINKQYIEQKKIPSRKYEFLTKRMNIPEKNEAQIVTNWENIAATNQTFPNLDGEVCVGGLDYADVQDFCGCVLLFKKNGKLYVKHHTFICSKSPHLQLIKFDLALAKEKGLITMLDTPTIESSIVVNWFVEQANNYSIKKIALDVFRYRILKEEFEKYGFYAVSKENPDGRLVLVRSGPITHNQIAPLVDELFANHRIVYGDDPMMRWYTNNTGVKTDGKGNKTYFKIEYQSRKNDGFMALIHALTIENELPNDEIKNMNFDSFGF